MSKLVEYRELERHLAEQTALLDSLKNDPALQKEVEFEEKLRALLGEYGKSLRNIEALLDPVAKPAAKRSSNAQPEKKTRKARVLKTYKNPLTDEVVQTKGGNHATLKAWKAEFGAEEVDSWLQG
jgi:hypothetical protein